MRLFLALFLCTASPAFADSLRSSYSTTDGRAGTVIIACPSQDGSFSAAACTSKPASVTYAAPTTATITTPNVAVTVFPAGTVTTGCDVVNTASSTLYLDFTATAAVGAPTSIPLQPGQSFHCPYPPTGAVTAVASQAQSFVAIRY